MASGNRKQAARRAETPIRGRRASPRVLAAAAAGILVIGGGIAAGVALSNGSGKSAAETTTSATTTSGTTTAPSPAQKLHDTAAVSALLAGIPQHGEVLGDPSAPVRLVEYADVQCPYCRDAELNTITDVIRRYVRTGKASLELRLLASIGSDSARGRAAALAAGRQNKLFNLVTLLYHNQGEENTGWLTDGFLRRAASDVPGLSVPRLVAAMRSPSVSQEARLVDLHMVQDKISETPTFFVGRRGTKLQLIKLQSSIDVTTLPAAIDAAGA